MTCLFPRFDSDAYRGIAQALRRFDPRRIVELAAGLLTVPLFQPETLRIEVLIHLAILYCRGRTLARVRNLRELLHGPIADVIDWAEDPPEDVFVSNVVSAGENFRVFNGMWEAGDFHLQDTLDAIFRSDWSRPHFRLRARIMALLRISEEVARRRGLVRWTSSEPGYPIRKFLVEEVPYDQAAAAVQFDKAGLYSLGAEGDAIAPFILDLADGPLLGAQELGNSILERRPLVKFGTEFVLALPSSISSCLRRYVLEWCVENDRLAQFSSSIRAKHSAIVFERGLSRIADGPAESLHEVASSPLRRADFGVARFDVDKVAHVVLWHDELDNAHKEGLTSAQEITAEESQELSAHLQAAVDIWSSKGQRGLILIVLGGVGRGVTLPLPELPSGWEATSMTIEAFDTFVWSNDTSFLRMWKLLHHESQLTDRGIHIARMGSLLDLYTFWEQSGFRLIPENFEYPTSNGLVIVDGSFTKSFRARHRQTYDIHAVPTTGGAGLAVRRLHAHSLFRNPLKSNVFASEDLALAGQLGGVVESSNVICWMTAERPKAPREVRSFLAELWDGLLSWLERLLPIITRGWQARLGTAFLVHLRLGQSEDWNHFSERAGDVEAKQAMLEISPESGTVSITIPFGFLSFFRRPTNDAERALLELMAEGIQQLGSVMRSESVELTPAAIAAMCLGGDSARSVHLFETRNPIDRIIPLEHPQPRFVPEEDRLEWELGLAWRVIRQTDSREIAGKQRSTDFLNAAVESLWQDVRARLEHLERESVIEMAIKNIESAMRERSWWRTTSRALDALYSSEANVAEIAAKREGSRSLAIHTARILTEMSLSTCPITGQIVSKSEYDSLTGAVAVLLMLSMESTAIHTGVAAPVVGIRASGQLHTDREFIRETATPYVLRSFSSRFQGAIADYDSLFSEPHGTGSGARQGPLFTDPNLIAAFEAEYGLTPGRLIEAVAELLDIAIEVGAVYVRTTLGDLNDRLRERRGFSLADCNALVSGFGLANRPRWDKAPPGFLERDWQPWRFRRRLSMVARPIILLGPTEDSALVFGLQNLGSSLSYLLHSIEAAWLPQEYFRTSAMKKYLGTVADRLGHFFTLEVQTALGNIGWITESEVAASRLGGSSDLGDFDVLAWHVTDKRLLAIECKRLQPARSGHEIAELLEEFRGEAGDRLGRHLARSEWLRANLESASQRLGVTEMKREVISILVTNAEVPMSFKRDLLLPPDQVIPLTRLTDKLSPTS